MPAAGVLNGCLGDGPDVPKPAVLLCPVDAVPDDEAWANRQPRELGRGTAFADEECASLHRDGLPGGYLGQDGVHRGSRVRDILDHDHVTATHVGLETFHDIDAAGRARAGPVGTSTHEVDLEGHGQLADEVGEEDERAFEDADQEGVPVAIRLGYLAAQAAHDRTDLLLGEARFELHSDMVRVRWFGGQTMQAFIRGLPKAELHVHIEGTLEPELLFEIGRRNRIALRFGSVEELRGAYRFTDLQSFLGLYYEGSSVLRTEDDFHALTRAYLERASHDGVRHAEIFFDPQAHTERGVAFATVVMGIHRALEAGRREQGISWRLILCFLRHLGAERAMATLEEALPFRDRIVGVGLDSTELGHPPRKFVEVFARARREGFRIVAHAGEEGPAAYIWEALDLLGAERIDHGVRAIEDPALVAHLARERVPLTVCPLSNVRLGVVPSMQAHCLKALLEHGVRVTINSDDPAYFGAYVADNYLAAARALGLGRDDLWRLAANSLEAAFLAEPEKRPLLAELDAYVAASRSTAPRDPEGMPDA